MVIGFITIISIIFGLLIFISFQNNQKALHKKIIASTIVSEALERRLLADEYTFNQTERAKEQWLVRQVYLEQLLVEEEGNFTSAEEKELITTVKDNTLKSQAIFQELVALYGEPPSEFFQEKSDGLKNRLLVSAQETISAASLLEDKNNSYVQSNSLYVFVLLSTASFIYFILLIVSFIQVLKNIKLIEQKKAQDEAILSSIGDAVFAIDRKEKIILFNRAAEIISGYSAAEAMDKHYSEILKFKTESDGEQNDEFIKKAMQGSQSHMTNHTVLVKKNGTEIPVADTASPLFDSGKNLFGVVAVFRDVTQERAIDKQKSEFISLASHQLRTPLGSARWNLEMLQKEITSLSTSRKMLLHEAYTSTLRCIRLVADLLNVARIDQGRIKNEPVMTNPVAVIQEAIQEIKPEARKKSVTLLSLHPGKETFYIYIDAQRFREAIQNLLSNAIRYTPQGGKVYCTIQRKNDDIEIAVSDTGIGIPEKQQSRIFSKYFRTENASKIDTEGSGLGLFIVKSFVDGWGGKIWFDSKEDAGTTFYMRIPMNLKKNKDKK